MFGRLRNSSLGMLKRAFDYRSLTTAQLIQRNLSTIGAPLRPEGGQIRVDALGLTLDPSRHEDLLRAMPALLELREIGAELRLDDGRLEIQIGAAKLRPETFQEIYIVHEVFVDEIYGVTSAGPMYVWDVGANVATASIYFAAVKGWDVSAYELFPQTAEAAQANIRRSGLENRIDLAVFGVGSGSKELSLPYNERSRGSNGLFGNLALDREGPETQVTVRIADAAVEFERVRGRAGGLPIFAKLDCEGAEFEIVERLAEANLLGQIEAFAIEIHRLPDKDPASLTRRLTDAGFVVLGPTRLVRDVGMLRAVRAG